MTQGRSMTFLEFASSSPFLTAFLVIVAALVLSDAVKLISRVLRTINIMARGWPPEHLDADGDFKPAADLEADDAR